MAPTNPIARKLYLRIWLAVAGSVALLSLLVGWAWHQAEAQRDRQPPTPREVVVRNAAGDVIGSAEAQPRRVPGQGFEFIITLEDGEVLTLQMPPRNRTAAGGGPRRGSDHPLAWLRPPYGFWWTLGLAGLGVMIGVFPVARRLTQRLEGLQRGVQRWGEGDLSARLPEGGQDEVADLSRRFNAAAERVQSLMASQAALLQSQKSLLANASHELRSPLARIRMAIELVGAQGSPTARAEIQRNIAELDQLVDEILLASRLDAREADVGTVELVDLIGLAAEECARVDADLDVSAAPNGLEVQGITKLLRRAVRNLLENARRYSSGEITVTLLRGPHHAEVRVCDRGPGVPPGQRERIFEPFYRLPGASERAGGVGLGLALVRSIAGRHKGTVHCEDREGGGACFVLWFPLSN